MVTFGLAFSSGGGLDDRSFFKISWVGYPLTFNALMICFFSSTLSGRDVQMLSALENRVRATAILCASG